MPIEVVGDNAYELIYMVAPPLTDVQAEALVAEYAELGLPYKKCTWQGYNCVIIKAPALEYKAFEERRSAHWQSIQERVGCSGYLLAKRNTYQPGMTSFSPQSDWDAVVAFIEANFSSASRAAARTPRPSAGQTAVRASTENKKWWQFWK